ncbi:nuclear transport factor 2 family protein [Pseudonocardia sp. KRD291]|uniref:nuclear transport factor 2 family protein n=1 Tax=Pseudonocardia sp. KRD291 TaxID=2792007 RepID=UPI001C4A0899|nr:hypothetical protein [Pseudonocardia sp. KRD291]MBW0104759.1 hypothetical protein [Pseudonocardia sp. KRD291]
MTATDTSPAARMIGALDSLTVDHELIADGATAWHNFDNLDMALLDTFESVRTIRTKVPDFRFTDVRTTAPGDDGVSVARYTFRGTLPDGADVAAHACLVVHTEAGRVTRIEEYLDTAQLAPILALLA